MTRHQGDRNPQRKEAQQKKASETESKIQSKGSGGSERQTSLSEEGSDDDRKTERKSRSKQKERGKAMTRKVPENHILQNFIERARSISQKRGRASSPTSEDLQVAQRARLAAEPAK